MAQFAYLEPEVDPRASADMQNLDLLRRIDLWRLADKIGVVYPQGATAETMRKILEAVPHISDAINAVRQDPDMGKPVVSQIVDKFHQPEENRQGKRVEGQDDLLLSKMTPFALQGQCKKRGIVMPRNAKKPELLAALGVEIPGQSPS